MNEPDVRALLALHQQDRQAHLTGDADLLADSMAEHVWEAGRGQLTRLSRDDVRERFASYFAEVRYSVWDDLVPVHVQVSGDGTIAWMAVHIEAALAERNAPADADSRRFESSWIAAYEKTNDRWLMVGISSSVVDRT